MIYIWLNKNYVISYILNLFPRDLFFCIQSAYKRYLIFIQYKQHHDEEKPVLHYEEGEVVY